MRIDRLLPSLSSLYNRKFVSNLCAMSTRKYSDAIDHLNSLQSNKATLEAVKASRGQLSQYAIPEMVEYLERIGYTTTDLNKLNVIHITGTKGKGSTSAFVNSILRHVKPEWKIGLYTSPHMVSARERIRINGVPIAEDDFTRYFFEVWDRLDANPERKNPITSAKPMYFRFMTLVAWHAFLSMKVDATILEVGVGGTYDSTNIVPKPIVTGITSLGLDHQGVLGNTIPEIASQKAGIYKEGVPALTVYQPEGLDVIRERARELKASEFIVVNNMDFSNIKLGLAGDHQISNASLAVKLAQTFLHQKESIQPEQILSKAYIEGLQNTRWPGRCQTVLDPQFPKTTWYLDGAHTKESLQCCMQWYVSPGVGLPLEPSAKRSRVLIFNITHGRSGTAFLNVMETSTANQLKLHGRPEEDARSLFDHVIFCTNVTYANGKYKSDILTVNTTDTMEVQQELAFAWASLHPTFPSSNIHVEASIEQAVKVVRDLESKSNENLDVLVTGSLHLVGGLIEAASLGDVAL